jgi:cytochrome o ubiquinol oxidase operon protein cyoD
MSTHLEHHDHSAHSQLNGAHAVDAHDHGSVRTYATGFVLSVILTAIPFAIVMKGGFGDPVVTALVVLGFAVVQILVHMVYFLHMTAKSEAGWTLLSTIFTIMVVGIMLSGSIWVMYHMNANMMPKMPSE